MNLQRIASEFRFQVLDQIDSISFHDAPNFDVVMYRLPLNFNFLVIYSHAEHADMLASSCKNGFMMLG